MQLYQPEIILSRREPDGERMYAVTHTGNQHRLIYHVRSLFEAGALQRALERVQGVDVWERP